MIRRMITRRAAEVAQTGPIDLTLVRRRAAEDRWRRAAEVTGTIALGMLLGVAMLPW